MDQQSTRPHPPRRRRLHFSLATLFVLVTAIGAVLALVMNELAPARQQQRAATAVRRLGGHVTVERSEGSGIVSGWLRVFLTDQYFANVEHASLGESAREEDLNCLQAFPHLKTLGLSQMALNGGPSTWARLKAATRWTTFG